MPRKSIYEGNSSQAFNVRVRDVQKGRIKYKDRKASKAEIGSYEEKKSCAGEGKKLVGYTKCDCNAGFHSGVVLDPFMGSGTTAIVAKTLGRSYIGFEQNREYIEMANERIGKVCR